MKAIQKHGPFFLLVIQTCLARDHFSFDRGYIDYEYGESEAQTEVTCPPGQTPIDKPEGMVCMRIPGTPGIPGTSEIPGIPDPRRTTQNDRIIFEEIVGKFFYRNHF